VDPREVKFRQFLISASDLVPLGQQKLGDSTVLSCNLDLVL
jgi:hypothetical protein